MVTLEPSRAEQLTSARASRLRDLKMARQVAQSAEMPTKRILSMLRINPDSPRKPAFADYYNLSVSGDRVAHVRHIEESWSVTVLLVDTGQSDDVAFEQANVSPGHYGGPGCAFVRCPTIDRNGFSILVKQSGGWDI